MTWIFLAVKLEYKHFIRIYQSYGFEKTNNQKQWTQHEIQLQDLIIEMVMNNERSTM